ncbi:MAG TPA: acyclic terpene utilization AtuA family protein [Acidimicrobiia bacterium]|nr:acyclic terpene utilization AtuA family protein [Acidimicrobiia bacterium]
MPADRIVIANCGGFWGDDPTAARRQVEGGPVDYLVMDYLAEVTMAILQKQRQRKPEAGYATDFVAQLRDVLPTCVERGIKVISNAGGVNPLACKAAVERLADELGVGDRVRVGVVLGDDIYDRLDDLIAGGETLSNMDTGRPLADERANVLSANAYLGAAPVVKALELGANVVITGRVTDTGVTLAPMIHEFGWAADDWNRLAAGIVAGHIIECGTQCTGGNFTDWHKVKSYSNLGFPLVEALPDGTFTVTKHPGTGGLVTVHTVSEQLLYEMGTPQYLAPDCIARFDSIRLTQDGPDRVKVTGIVGEPPPEKLKVSISFAHGYRAFGRLIVSGPDALAKAEKVAQIFWESAGGPELYEDASTQFLAWSATHPSLTDSEPSEIVVQVAVRDSDERKINSRFGVQVVPRVLGSVPGITYFADMGRPRASDVVGYWPALITRTAVPMRVVVGDDEVDVPYAPVRLTPPLSGGHPPSPGNLTSAAAAGAAFTPESPPRPSGGGGQTVRVPLSRLCLARSGDKGDTCNVGLLARSEAIYGWMVDYVTPAFVKERFAGICKGGVDRHDVPNLLACNFLLHESLGGGGTMSLLLDAQGKTYAQYLLATEVEVEAGLLDGVE